MISRPRRKELLVFGAPSIGQPEIDEVVDSLRSGWIGTGFKVKQFEEKFAEFQGVENCIAVNSCTAALHLSLLALNLQPGDEVITTPLTFCATVNSILHAGAIPVLADVDPDSMNIDPAEIESKITSNTKAIMPVHFAGRAANMARIMAIADANNLRVVEDCAHAIETKFEETNVGTIGDFGCFSFYATKNITTAEGGMIICRREADLERLRRMALHGLSHDAWRRFRDLGHKHYFVTELGYKYNMTDLQAAIGLHQFDRIEESSTRRQEIWARYNEELSALPIELPAALEPDRRHAMHLYTILIDERNAGISRDAFLEAMRQENIGTGVHYLSVAAHPYYQENLGWNTADWPNANRIGLQTVSLPISAKLTDDDVSDVIAAVRRVLE